MNKLEKIAFIAVGALAFTSGGFAFGQSVNLVSSSQVIYACVTGVNGNITKVSNTQKTCPRGTSPISWNAEGPKGDQGIQGPKGDQGIQGQSGQSSALQTYLVSPDGQSQVQLINFPTVSTYPFAKFENLFWSNWQNAASESGLTGWENLEDKVLGYETTDCSGQTYWLMNKLEVFNKGIVFQLGKIPVEVKESNVNAAQILSFKTKIDIWDQNGDSIFGTTGCLTFDSQSEIQLIPPQAPNNPALQTPALKLSQIYSLQPIEAPQVDWSGWHVEVK